MLTGFEEYVIGAVAKAAVGGVLGKILQVAKGSSPEAQKVIKKVYDKLASNVSPNSLRVLMVLHHSGAYLLPDQIAKKAQEAATRQEPYGKPLEADITYRLRYLGALGLVLVNPSDCALTDLGAAFIDHARANDRHHYGKVFSEFGAR